MKVASQIAMLLLVATLGAADDSDSCVGDNCKDTQALLQSKVTVGKMESQDSMQTSMLEAGQDGMLEVNVMSAKELFDLPTHLEAATGFSLAALSSFVQRPTSIVKDAGGCHHTLLEFQALHEKNNSELHDMKFPLNFRINTSHATDEVGASALGLVDINELTRQMNRPSALMKRKRLQAQMANSTAGDVTQPENVIGLLAEKAKDYFAKRCGADSTTLDCGELRKCNKIATEVFVDPTKVQKPSADQLNAFVEGCKSEEAAVRAEIAKLSGDDKLLYSKAADAVLPKCEHMGRTMMGYLGSLEPGSLTDVPTFCAYMVNWVIPTEMESPCHQFMDLTMAEHMMLTKAPAGWPLLASDEQFEKSFMLACDVMSAEITDCASKVAAVKEDSMNYMAKLQLLPKNHSKSMLASMEEEYTAATCSMLGFTGFSLTEQDVIELRNQHTHRAATGLHFVKAHSGLLFEALTLGMMTEMVLTKSAKYIAAAVDMPGHGLDGGIGFGVTGREVQIGLAMFSEAQSGAFWSACKVAGTNTNVNVGIAGTRFNNYKDIEGATHVISVGASYKVGAEIGGVFCCPSLHSHIGQCGYCGFLISPQAGYSASASYAVCQTFTIWEFPAVPFGPPIRLVNPVSDCFPGHATVDTPAGKKEMRDLRVGDHVLTVSRDGTLTFDPVYFFGHADPTARALYLAIRVDGDVLHLSKDHFVPVCRSHLVICDWRERLEVYARDVKVGDAMWVSGPSGVELKIVGAIDTQKFSGVFNPYTTSGTIVVDGVVASCHSSWILDDLTPQKLLPWLPTAYQALFLPGRWLYQMFGPAAASFLDMNNPQSSPETFGYGPQFVFGVYGLLPMISMLALPHAKRLQRSPRCS